jgi:hypothetical protein
MIYFLGDIHGGFERLVAIASMVNPEDTVIQVGDFGFYPTHIVGLQKTFLPDGFPCKFYAIDGNHEHFPILFPGIDPDKGIVEFHYNMYYVPRGTVLEIEDHLIGFLGGADSVDKSWREPYGKWYSEETITEADLNRLYQNVNGRQLDVLVAHAAPPMLINGFFPPLNFKWWGLPKGWVDVSSLKVMEAIDTLSPKKFVCGHMHKSVKLDNMRILNINELIDITML